MVRPRPRNYSGLLWGGRRTKGRRQPPPGDSATYLREQPVEPVGRSSCRSPRFAEEIGKGVLHFDVAKLGATVAYTMDGGKRGEIEHETFCADAAVVTFTGRDIHPGYAKDRMVPALKVAGAFLERACRIPHPGKDDGATPPTIPGTSDTPD